MGGPGGWPERMAPWGGPGGRKGPFPVKAGERALFLGRLASQAVAQPLLANFWLMAS